MTKKLNIGLIGAGWMGKTHTNAFLNAKMLSNGIQTEIVFHTISDVNEDAAKNTAMDLGFKNYTTNWMEVISNEEVDLIDIATPNAFHYEVAKAALENGKNVYCEKPLTLSAEQSKELALLAQEKNVINYSGYNNVMNPAIKYIKQLIEQGQLGSVTKVLATYDQDSLLDAKIPITWRHINKFSGSGALGDLGSHILSISQYLLGDIIEVNATAKTFIEERPVSANSNQMQSVENEDVITILAQYENGALGIISSSRIATGRKNHLHFEIQGTKGTVHYTLERMNEVEVYFEQDEINSRGFRKVFLGPEHEGYSVFYPAAGIGLGYNDMKILEALKILEVFDHGAAYDTNFEFAAKIDCLIDAILQSVKTNASKKINYGLPHLVNELGEQTW